MPHTIAALATPPGTSALAVIRISGPDVQIICQKLLGRDLKPRQMQRVCLRDLRGEILDDILACYFPGPKSYTGEDLLELFPHGNMVLVRRILKEIYSIENVYAAEPGEFTRRAFENGKIDLVQAEAVGQLIHSTNEASLINAQRLLSGELSLQIHDLVEEIKWLSAKMELDVDFSEEEADPDFDSWLLDLQSIHQKLRQLLDSWERHSKLQTTPRIALCGKPNAGKSSLINALVKEDRLLVSSQAGTTRDWVEVPLFLEGGEVLLIDTAGFGEAIDDLDAQSQKRSRERIAHADLVIWVEDGTEPASPPDFEIHHTIRTRADQDNFDAKSAFAISSINGYGVESLKQFLSQLLIQKEEDQGEAWMGTERQAQGIQFACKSLENAIEMINNGSAQVEILAFELREARNFIEEVTGSIAVDEILGKIFEGFCIGK